MHTTLKAILECAQAATSSKNLAFDNQLYKENNVNITEWRKILPQEMICHKSYLLLNPSMLFLHLLELH